MFAHHRLPAVTAALAGALVWAASAAAEEVDYARHVRPLLKVKCFACHGALRQEGGLRLDAGELIRSGGDSGRAVIPGDPDGSLLLARVSATDEAERMPAEGKPLTAEQIGVLRAWILAGAKSPPDETAPEDPRKHWAFQPLRAPASSEPGAIDRLIGQGLQEAGLRLAPEADRVTLVRRLYLDVHGLPPSPEEVAEFVADERPDAWARLVDRVLASPRYGERWAQHWLDVVRYADTHGYEVNTPRDHAWPYRDYVIRAFNADKPYDRFVFEQLAGDTVGQHAATGFLVAAAVLLPGQIGADDASKRLARADALDDILVGTGAAFLGLTIGCARCHEHKFDPISQADYYALQAFFAGVEYGDREIDDPARRERLAQAAELAPRIAALRARLDEAEPVARTARTIILDDENGAHAAALLPAAGHEANPEGNARGCDGDVGSEDRMPNVSGGKYTWWTSAPGENVFAWNPGAAGRFRVWLSWGVGKSHAADARYLIDADGKLDTSDDRREIARVDQRKFDHASEAPSDDRLWSGAFDAGVHELGEASRLVLQSGDSEGIVTADVVILQEAAGNEATDDDPLPRLRSPLDARGNVERFAPRGARFVRFTTLATVDNNLHEPCIDELEVFTAAASSAAATAPTNVALAANGAKATSSGNISETGIHQLSHVNDGRVGNSHSWISNEKGTGWVQLELAEPQSIDRVVWSRDRDGQYADRLAVRYRVDVSMDGNAWTTVATSDDRMPEGTPDDPVLTLLRNRPAGVTDDLPAAAEALQRLSAQKAQLKKPTLVFAGTFRQPDVTHVLHRGDPEQPQARVGPRVPEILGSLALEPDAPERERRVALARWIASADNPLTARVMANRVWQHHFGRGLVDTPSDFGLEGDRPSHPELLDWLSGQLIASGWSVKHLHRLILNSEVYRQANRIDPDAAKRDADCRLVWRFPSRRLEAEAIRDSMLAASGRLNLQMGGPGYNFFKTRGGLDGFPPIEKFTPAESRRMIYAHKIRMEPVPVFGAFDCPDAGQSTPKRSRSTTALQALNLFNSPFVADEAAALAARVRREAGDSTADQVRRAWLVAVGRVPEERELEACRRVVEEHDLATLARVIFNTNEFLFIP